MHAVLRPISYAGHLGSFNTACGSSSDVVAYESGRPKFSTQWKIGWQAATGVGCKCALWVTHIKHSRYRDVFLIALIAAYITL